jgi:outer membrane lipase/esterase
MKVWKLATSAIGAAMVLAACGGGGGGDQAPKVSFTGMVSFGDSLSDVGSYKVGTIAAKGGGEYTVNGPTALNWTAIVAKAYGLPVPCAAQTGLDGLASQGLSVPVTNVATCFGYAQGGARVTLQPGPGNKLLGGANAVLGQLTVPVKDQMLAHLTKVGGAYTGSELVTVLAGGNDFFIQAEIFKGTVAQLIASGKTPAEAQATAGTAAGTAMGTAGAELAGYVKALIVGKGAKNVVVVNLPNVSKTPDSIDAGPQAQAFADQMTNIFNEQLKQGLNGVPGVVLADAYTESTTQANNPGPYGLTNVKDRACDKDPTKNILGGQSLVCNASNVIAGDVSHYQYADGVHLTPYGYELLAKFVLSEMIKAGLL